MNQRLLSFACIIALLLSSALLPSSSQQVVAASFCQSVIEFGDTIQCSIAASAEVDDFSFEASVNDVVQVSVARTSDNLNPRARIYAPNGTEVCRAYTYGDVASNECTLPSTGTYKLQVDAVYEGQLGNYNLYLQRLNNPGNAQPINFGQTTSSRISTIAERDTYTFTAAVDDLVQVRVARTSDNLNPRARIIGPNGTEACRAYTYGNVAGSECTLRSAGRYTLQVDAVYEGQVGNYNLYLQRLNNPGEAQPINFGQTLTASITTIAELDTYTFTAVVDDVVKVVASRTSDNLNPRIRIYGPRGNQVCSAFTYGTTAQVSSCTLPSEGSYTMQIDAVYEGQIGNYTLFLQCLNSPCGPPIVYTSQVYIPMVVK